jgi:uncharacterized cupredoxin-like copper-binding protein
MNLNRPPMPMPRTIASLLSLLATLSFLTAACSSGGNKTSPNGSAPSIATATAASSGTSTSLASVNVKAREYAFDAPDTIPAGLTQVRMDNVGSEDHQAQLLKLNPGVTLEQFSAGLQKGPTAALTLASATGGPNAQAPSQSADAVTNLDPGQYVFICFVPAADGVPHFAKGMIKPLQVTAAASSGKAAELPAAKQTVTLRDFNFDAPQSLQAGKLTIAVKNMGPQPHEMSLVKLKGVNADQFKAAVTSTAAHPPGPPPFTSAGGMGGIMPGTTGETTVDLTPGTYGLVCNIPDAATGKPHVQLGMVWTFDVK